MPRVIVTEGAIAGLERCQQYLLARSTDAARRAGRVIAEQFALLEKAPEAGRPFPDEPTLRELLIPFGASGYVALYRYEEVDQAVYILAFRHQREAGYG